MDTENAPDTLHFQSPPSPGLPAECRTDPLKPAKKAIRVLVADDQASVRGWLGYLLCDWGYEVVNANGGLEAVQILLQDDSPAVAILDWMMPDMDGTEVCRRVRQAQRARYVYMLLLTSKSEQSDMLEGLNSGADDYLRKPFNPLELRARLEVATRIAAEKTLRDNQQKFHAAAELATAGMAVSDLEGKFLEVNAEFCRFLGYSREELLQKTVFEICHPDDLGSTREHFAQFARGSLSVNEERRYIHQSGITVWALLTISFVRHGDGSSDFVVAQIQDITKQKAAEAVLRRNEAMFRAITENTEELIRVLEPDGTIVYCSPSHEMVLGYSIEELRGCGSIQLVHPDDHEKAKHWCQQLLQAGKTSPSQFRFRHKNGSIRVLDSCGGVIRNVQGQVEKLVVTSRDMTERRLWESRLQQAQKLESIAQLAAGVAHEINTPIQYVSDNVAFVRDAWQTVSNLYAACYEVRSTCDRNQMAGDVLKKLDGLWKQIDFEYLHAEVPAALAQTVEGVQRIAGIVQALKDFSSPRSEHKELCHLNRTIQTIIAVSRNEWQDVAEVESVFDDNLPPVACLAAQFKQAILQILINAVQAIAKKYGGKTGHKGVIRVSTKRIQDCVEISIADSGGGISREIRDRVYDPFFTTKEIGTALGHGLTFAHSAIVKEHGGELWFESEEGRGTTFFIRIPLNG